MSLIFQLIAIKWIVTSNLVAHMYEEWAYSATASALNIKYAALKILSRITDNKIAGLPHLRNTMTFIEKYEWVQFNKWIVNRLEIISWAISFCLYIEKQEKNSEKKGVEKVECKNEKMNRRKWLSIYFIWHAMNESKWNASMEKEKSRMSKRITSEKPSMMKTAIHIDTCHL